MLKIAFWGAMGIYLLLSKGIVYCRDVSIALIYYFLILIHLTDAILPKRWIVERTFAWFGNFRRLAKDFEILTERAENMIRIAMMKITLAKVS